MIFSNDYAEWAQLDEGIRLQVRAIRPSDKAALASAFSQLSFESRRQRFNGAKTTLTDEELRFLTECDGQSHYALVALHPGDERTPPQGVGVVRFIRADDEPAVAEIGIAVADTWQRRGVGRLLLERIVAAAGERGVERLRAVVRVDNPQMNGLLRDIAAQPPFRRDGEMHIVEFGVPAARHTDTFDALVNSLRRLTCGTMNVPLRLGEISLRFFLGTQCGEETSTQGRDRNGG